MMKRRDFLRGSGSVVLSSLAGAYGARAYARVNNSLANMLNLAVETDRVLVMVFLNGGNDGLNTLVPLAEMSRLAKARPEVLLPENKLIELPGTGLGMHPALADFKSLYDEKKLQIIQNVGYENPDFSHFRSTDIWMSASDSDQLITSGWTGRYLDHEYEGYPFDYPNAENPDPLAIEIGRSTSLLFQGPSASMGMAIHDPNFFYDLINDVEHPVPDGPAGERIQLIRILAKQSEKYSSRVRQAASAVPKQASYPNLGLADQLKIVANLIAGGLQTRLYLVQIRQFDTHANQVDRANKAEGLHSRLLSEVSRSIKAFVDDCEFLGIGDRVLGMTFSEFGRRIISNASYGTDHGAAAPLFFFGNTLQGGIIGANPIVPEIVGVRDSLPHEFEFRQIYSTVFQQWFCMNGADVSGILGDFDTLDVVRSDLQCESTVSSTSDVTHESRLSIYPSPASQYVNIELRDRPASGVLQVIQMDGRIVHRLTVPSLDPGIPLRIETNALPAGKYVVQMVDRSRVISGSVIKR